MIDGVEQLREVAELLKAAGTEGQGFRRALVKQLDEAAKPLAKKIADPERMKPYMPDRYAGVLAGDLSVTTQRTFAGSSPGVTIVAKGRVHKRKVAFVERGELNHPVFAQGLRHTWDWVNGQTDGMKPGFFTDPCEEAAPEIRDHMIAALDETFRKIAP